MSRLDHRRAHVQQMLTTFVPADAEEDAHRERMCALAATAEDPFDRGHYGPGHFTASAFVLAPDRDALLLILHAKLGRWLQPGGHVEPLDQDLCAAAQREVREETGLDNLRPLLRGPLDLDVHAIPPLKGAPAHEHHDVRFAFVADRLDASAASDAKAARWVRLSEVNAVESDRSVMRAVEKLHRLGA